MKCFRAIKNPQESFLFITCYIVAHKIEKIICHTHENMIQRIFF